MSTSTRHPLRRVATHRYPGAMARAGAGPPRRDAVDGDQVRAWFEKSGTLPGATM